MSTLRKLWFSIIAAIVLCCASVMTAQADTTIFATRAAFTAATTGTTIINFNGIAPPGSIVPRTPFTTISGVTFATPTNALYIVDAAFGGVGAYDFGPGFDRGGVLSVQGGAGAPSGVTLLINFDSAVTAIGFDVNSFVVLSMIDPISVTATLGNGDVVNFTTLGNPGRFFGFTTTPGILSLTLRSTTPNAVLNLDSFTFGRALGVPPTGVPEPATMILLGTGLAGIAAKMRRRKNNREDKAA